MTFKELCAWGNMVREHSAIIREQSQDIVQVSRRLIRYARSSPAADGSVRSDGDEIETRDEE